MKAKKLYVVRNFDYELGDGTGTMGEFATAYEAFVFGLKKAKHHRRVIVQQWATNSSGDERLYELVEWVDGKVSAPSWCELEDESQPQR